MIVDWTIRGPDYYHLEYIATFPGKIIRVLWRKCFPGYGILAIEESIYANSEKYDAVGAIIMHADESGSVTFNKATSDSVTFSKVSYP